MQSTVEREGTGKRTEGKKEGLGGREGVKERKLYGTGTVGLWEATRGPLTEICSETSELCW